MPTPPEVHFFAQEGTSFSSSMPAATPEIPNIGRVGQSDAVAQHRVVLSQPTTNPAAGGAGSRSS
jgi:hypothetical protein